MKVSWYLSVSPPAFDGENMLGNVDCLFNGGMQGGLDEALELDGFMKFLARNLLSSQKVCRK